MIIRPMLTKDLPNVRSLCEELGYPVTLEELTERFIQIENNEIHYLRVVQDSRGNILAFIHATKSSILTDRIRCEIVGLIVTKAERRKGIGERLVAATEEWAKNAGILGVRVRSQALRESAHDFYKELSYELKKIQNVFIKDLSQKNPVKESKETRSSLNSELDHT